MPPRGTSTKSGISQILGTVGIGPFHRLGHQMNGFGGIVPQLSYGICFQDVEDLNDVGAARRGR